MDLTKRLLKVCVISFVVFLSAQLTVRAQNITNQATQITFTQPVEIPGKVLPHGTYWFTVLDSGQSSDPNIVQVTSADRKTVIATLTTQNAEQAEFGEETTAQGVKWPSGKVVLRVAEGKPNQPVALLDWYYPGNTSGHKFVYDTSKQKQLDEYKHETKAFKPGDKITIGGSAAAFE